MNAVFRPGISLSLMAHHLGMTVAEVTASMCFRSVGETEKRKAWQAGISKRDGTFADQYVRGKW